MNIERVELLLESSSSTSRLELLGSWGLLNESGLSQVLSAARSRMGAHPSDAGLLAELCIDGCRSAGIHGLVPHALYLRAQSEALLGDLKTARHLIEAAQCKFDQLGMRVDSLRTRLGLVHVLNELNQFSEATSTARSVLVDLEAPEFLNEQLSGREAQQLRSAASVNLAICYRRAGNLQDALPLLLDAEKEYLSRSESVRVADTRLVKGNVLQSLGRTREAIVAFESAARVYAGADQTLNAARAGNNAAYALSELGEYTQALESFESSQQLFEACSDVPAMLYLDKAETHLALNLTVEAEEGFRRAADLFDREGAGYEEGRAQLGLGRALVDQGRYDEADRAFAVAASRFLTGECRAKLAELRLAQAELSLAKGNESLASGQIQEVLSHPEVEGWPAVWNEAHLLLAELALPDADNAEEFLLSVDDSPSGSVTPSQEFRRTHLLGRVRREQGRTSEALVLFESAVAQIDRLRKNLAEESLQQSFMRDKTAAYDDLAAIDLKKPQLEQLVRSAIVGFTEFIGGLRTLAAAIVQLVRTVGSARSIQEIRELVSAASSIWISGLSEASAYSAGKLMQLGPMGSNEDHVLSAQEDARTEIRNVTGRWRPIRAAWIAYCNLMYGLAEQVVHRVPLLRVLSSDINDHLGAGFKWAIGPVLPNYLMAVMTGARPTVALSAALLVMLVCLVVGTAWAWIMDPSSDDTSTLR